MADFFFYGTLRHAPLLAQVLGELPQLQPARLPGHEVRMAMEGAAALSFPVLCRGGAGAEGVLARGLSQQQVARLQYYEAGFVFSAQPVVVQSADGPQQALVFQTEPGRWQAGPLWQLQPWVRQWGEIVTAAAEDFMAMQGVISPEAALARYQSILARAASRVRARSPGPAQLRRDAAAQDVAVAQRDVAYARFFSVEDYSLSHRRFDGGWSPNLARAAFVSCDAVAVLPYDARRDRVLLVEQFRTGPFARGDANPWLIEPIAGRIDADETPQVAARREALEEAGLHLEALLPCHNYYPSPGAKTEFIYSFIALCDLPDTLPAIGGMAGEGEDIRTHLLSFDDLMRLIASGEVNNGTLLVLALALAQRRAAVRAGSEL